MSTIKNENKEIYDGIKLNTESKERIIDELVEKIESNSNNISELDGLRRERMMKNNKMEGTVKTALVAIGSIAATFAIIVGVANYNNSSKKISGKGMVSESVTSRETITEKGTEKETEKETVKETEKVKETESKLNLANAKDAPDFTLVNEPNEVNGKWNNDPYEYEYAESDIDGDGKKDVVKLSFETSTKNEGGMTGKVILYMNDVEKGTYNFEFCYNPRNVKFIEMDDKCFVYFDAGELTSLGGQKLVSLQDYEVVLSDANLPFMSRVANVMVDNTDKKLIIYYAAQLRYIGFSADLFLDINYADGTFKTDNKWIEVGEDYSNNEWLKDTDGKYVLIKDAEFYDSVSDNAKMVTLKKGEKLTLKKVHWNDTLAASGDVSKGELNCFIDMYHFVTEEGKDVYLNPFKVDVSDYMTVDDDKYALFEGIHWAQ